MRVLHTSRNYIKGVPMVLLFLFRCRNWRYSHNVIRKVSVYKKIHLNATGINPSTFCLVAHWQSNCATPCPPSPFNSSNPNTKWSVKLTFPSIPRDEIFVTFECKEQKVYCQQRTFYSASRLHWRFFFCHFIQRICNSFPLKGANFLSHWGSTKPFYF